MNYEEAKAKRDEINDYVTKTSQALQAFPKNEMGLTPDHIKATIEWRKARAEFQLAFDNLRGFNKTFVKMFKREIHADIETRRNASKGASMSDTQRQPETSRTILTPSEPWPFLKAPAQSAKEKARAERERIKNLPVAPF